MSPKPTREPIDHVHEIVTNFTYSANGQTWHACKTCDQRFSVVPPNKPLTAPQPTAQAGEAPTVACENCRGRGEVNNGVDINDCAHCRGTGKVPAPPQDWGTHIDKGPGATHFKGDDCAPPTPSAGEARYDPNYKRCGTCGEDFDTHTALLDHARSAHSPQLPTPEQLFRKYYYPPMDKDFRFLDEVARWYEGGSDER